MLLYWFDTILLRSQIMIIRLNSFYFQIKSNDLKEVRRNENVVFGAQDVLPFIWH